MAELELALPAVRPHGETPGGGAPDHASSPDDVTSPVASSQACHPPLVFARVCCMLQAYVSYILNVLEQCCKVFHADVAKVDLDIAMLHVFYLDFAFSSKDLECSM